MAPCSKSKITNGVLSFFEKDIIPCMGADNPTQVVALTAVRYLRANTALTDRIFEKIRDFIPYDPGSDTYDVSALLDALQSAVSDCKGFHVPIPIPALFGSSVKTITLYAEDIAKLRKTIEEAQNT